MRLSALSVEARASDWAPRQALAPAISRAQLAFAPSLTTLGHLQEPGSARRCLLALGNSCGNRFKTRNFVRNQCLRPKRH